MAISTLVPNDVFIKWPNDIIVDSFKIAGILIENQWAANKLKSSIVGVGLNINQTEFNTSFSATSLYKLTHKEFVRKTFLKLKFL